MKKILTVIALAVATVASAQSLKVSTGGKSGTYSKMFSELSSVCMNEVQMIELNSTGSVQNIDRIVGNESHAVFSQTDVVFFRARTEDFSNIKTLVALHPEEVHVVSLVDSKIKEGGTMGFGAKPVQFNTVNDLAGRTVVAAGGSYITAQVIRLQTEIPFNVVEVTKNEDALAAVANGSAQAAILVGGQPLGTITALNKTYKLLSFPDATMAKLKNVYNPAKVTYSSVGAAGVQTISTSALLIAREYKTPKMVDGLAKLRSCILKNVPELAETISFHPAWSKVDVNNPGKWQFMQLQSTKK